MPRKTSGGVHHRWFVRVVRLDGYHPATGPSNVVKERERKKGERGRLMAVTAQRMDAYEVNRPARASDYSDRIGDIALGGGGGGGGRGGGR